MYRPADTGRVVGGNVRGLIGGNVDLWGHKDEAARLEAPQLAMSNYLSEFATLPTK